MTVLHDPLIRAALEAERVSRTSLANVADAVSAWWSLVGGEWTLVGILEVDGRRLMIARRNGPREPAVPLLTQRENRAVCLRARAWAVKQIADELGISQASVSRAVSSGMRKLGLASARDLVRFAERDPSKGGPHAQNHAVCTTRGAAW